MVVMRKKTAKAVATHLPRSVPCPSGVGVGTILLVELAVCVVGVVMFFDIGVLLVPFEVGPAVL